MARSLKTILDSGDANKLGAVAQVGRVGTMLSLLPRLYAGAVASHVLVLPVPALALLAVRSTAGTDIGEHTILNVTGTSASVGDGEAALDAKGDVVFDADDVVTAAEVLYVPAEGDLIEEVIPVASHSGTLLMSRKGVILREVEALVGSSTGVKTVVARGSSPSAGEAALGNTGATVAFNASDAVTSARVKYIALPGVGGQPAAVGNEWTAETREF